jgi:hypothetical protein
VSAVSKEADVAKAFIKFLAAPAALARDITRVVELVLDPPVLANGARGMVCIDRAVGQIE